MSAKASDHESVHILPEILDLGGAESLKHGLVEAAEAAEVLAIDGGNVERVSTPAVQVLLAVARDLSEKNRQVLLRNSSESLTTAFDDLGLSAELQRWSSC